MGKILLEELYGNFLRFNFLNGTIDLDESKYGAYALCPGCGSGKTTIVKQLIKMKWYEGILYSAFTIDECNGMYKWIKENLVGTRNETTSEALKLEDILVLHSDYTAEGTDKDLWLNNPDKIADKKIVICTHSKLLNEPLHLLINSNFNISISNAIGPLKASVIGSQGTLPRQWILIDESTEAKSIKFKVTKNMAISMGMLSDRLNSICKPDPNNPGRLIYSSVQLSKPRLVRADNYYSVFCNKLNGLAEFSPKTYLNQIIEEKTELDKIRNEQFRLTFFGKFNDLSFNENVDEVNINYSFVDLIDPAMMTRIILLDGTSDITLSNSKKFTLLSFDNRYNSPVNLKLFSMNGLERRIKLDKSIPDIDFYIKDKIEGVVDNLSNIIKENKKTLIFTWMDLKSDSTEVNDDSNFIQSNASSETEGIKLVSESKSTLINPNQSFYKYIQHRLEDRGFKVGEDFSVEYYGSGKDKAINDYRDYDAVVMCGNYRVPNSVISDFNLMFHTNITGTEYYANRAIQAICRTRIRLHNEDPINVYISSDWSGDTINYIKRYLKVDGYESLITEESKISIDYMYNELRKISISPKKAEKIAKISTLDENIFRAVVSRTDYSCSVSFDDLFNVIPVSRKDTDKYKYLINYLKRAFRVQVNIVS